MGRSLGVPWGCEGPLGEVGTLGDIGVPWGRLGTLWGHLGTLGDSWRPSGTFEDPWGRLGTLGDSWGPSGTRGAPTPAHPLSGLVADDAEQGEEGAGGRGAREGGQEALGGGPGLGPWWGAPQGPRGVGHPGVEVVLGGRGQPRVPPGPPGASSRPVATKWSPRATWVLILSRGHQIDPQGHLEPHPVPWPPQGPPGPPEPLPSSRDPMSPVATKWSP